MFFFVMKSTTLFVYHFEIDSLYIFHFDQEIILSSIFLSIRTKISYDKKLNWINSVNH